MPTRILAIWESGTSSLLDRRHTDGHPYRCWYLGHFYLRGSGHRHLYIFKTNRHNISGSHGRLRYFNDEYGLMIRSTMNKVEFNTNTIWPVNDTFLRKPIAGDRVITIRVPGDVRVPAFSTGVVTGFDSASRLYRVRDDHTTLERNYPIYNIIFPNF